MAKNPPLTITLSIGVDSKLNSNKNQLWYSQNFLHSLKLVIDLINKSKLTAEDHVLEIANQGLKNKCKNIFSYQQLKSLSRNYSFNLRANPTSLSFDQWYQLFSFLILL